MKNGLTGEARFVNLIKLSVSCGKPEGQGGNGLWPPTRFARMLSVLSAKRSLGQKGKVKKDEKSRENRLTERIIFDTMIKHLSTGENMGKRGTIR